MYYFTSESVSRGHPDKIADQISDLVLDYFLENDKHSRVAAETLVTPFKIVVAGEIRANFTPSHEDLEKKIRNLIKNIGYINGTFNYQSIGIEFLLNEQSADIALGVDATKEKQLGAGDQGIMFGFACKETNNLMPAAIDYSHKILQNIYSKLEKNIITGFGPDAKSQVTLQYDQNHNIVKADTILVSIQHEKNLLKSQIKDQLVQIIEEVIPSKFITPDTKFLFNPTGKFIIGGPESDVGLTGRKIIVDTYGGAAPHGGGAFSGKDPTKVDRSAAYMARYIAKNIVASGIASKCLIQLSYAIGIASPISIFIDSFNTSSVDNITLAKFIEENIDLTPYGIKKLLKLDNPIFLPTASYGHFGRKTNKNNNLFSWEDTSILSKKIKLFFADNKNKLSA